MQRDSYLRLRAENSPVLIYEYYINYLLPEGKEPLSREELGSMFKTLFEYNPIRANMFANHLIASAIHYFDSKFFVVILSSREGVTIKVF